MSWENELDRIERELDRIRRKEVTPPPQKPVQFCTEILKFTPTPYQQSFLEDESKRVLLCWSRQSGKSHSIAARAIWYSLTHAKTLTLIVAPSLRQSMILSDKIQDFLAELTAKQRHAWISRQQRTVITFSNGSRIIALPCSENLLRGYTANVVIADEANFFEHDQNIFYSILMPMLATTNGILIVSSTPWNKDSVFYTFYNDPKFSKHIVTQEQAVKAGIMSAEFIEEMRSLLPEERFEREFESTFVEDADAWLTQSLIVKCIDSNLLPYDFEDEPHGRFFIGVDLGKAQDYSVIVVVKLCEDNVLRTVHVHRFALGTKYASVIGYLKSLVDRWETIRASYVDVTGVGDYVVEDMKASGIRGVEGIKFTVQSKEDMANVLREKMRREQLKIPYIKVRSPHDVDLVAELNVEKYELTKTGHVKFSHPQNSHDDVFWAVALAVYASVKVKAQGLVDFGRVFEG